MNKMDKKRKMVLNVMRCLTGSEWGASRSASRNIYIAVIEYSQTMLGKWESKGRMFF